MAGIAGDGVSAGLIIFTVRASSIHRYLSEAYRARVNAFFGSIVGSIVSLLFDVLGEFLDYRLTMTIIALIGIFVCWFTTGRNKKELKKIYLYQNHEQGNIIKSVPMVDLLGRFL